MAGELPSISAVILTGGHREVVERTVAAALADPGTTEVVVVVVPEAGEVERPGPVVARLERLAATEPRLRVEPLPPDDGCGLWRVQRGRDAGVRLARGEVILGLDDDVVLDPGVVSGHAAAHAEDHDLVLVGYMPVATRQRWPRGNATIRRYAELYEGHCAHYEAEPAEILKNLWGGNVSLRRDAWLRAVERPRTTAWGHDDQELGLLFLREGMHARFDRSLYGRHYYTRSLAGYVERAEKSPVGQAALRAAHPDLLDSPVYHPCGRTAMVAEPLLAASRVPGAWPLLRGAMTGSMALLGLLHLTAAGDVMARFVWALTGERALRAQNG